MNSGAVLGLKAQLISHQRIWSYLLFQLYICSKNEVNRAVLVAVPSSTE